jgi:hypothetical protein
MQPRGILPKTAVMVLDHDKISGLRHRRGIHQVGWCFGGRQTICAVVGVQGDLRNRPATLVTLVHKVECYVESRHRTKAAVSSRLHTSE